MMERRDENTAVKTASADEGGALQRGAFRTRFLDSASRQEIPENEQWILSAVHPLEDEQLVLFNDTMAEFEFSRFFSKNEISELSVHFTWIQVRKGERVVYQGSVGELFFIIGRGVIECSMSHYGNGKDDNNLYAGDYFGDYSLITGQPRERDYTAVHDCILFCIDRESFLEHFLADTIVRHLMTRRAARRMVRAQEHNVFDSPLKRIRKESDEVLDALKKTDFFHVLGKKSRDAMISQMIPAEASPGSRIPMGKDGFFYVIASGRVCVVAKANNNTIHTVQHLRPGEYFGENELLGNGPLQREYYSLDDTRLFLLDRKDVFLEIFRSSFLARFLLVRSARHKDILFEKKYPDKKDASTKLSPSHGLLNNLMILLTMLEALMRTVHDFFIVTVPMVITSTLRSMLSISGVVKSFISSKSGYYHHSSLKRLVLLVKRDSIDQQRIVFFRLLAAMLNAGLTVPKALKVIIRQSESNVFGEVSSQIFREISCGSSFSKAVERHNDVFSPVIAAMIRCGEATGELRHILDRIGAFLEDDQRIRQKLKNALTYPLIVLSISFGIVFFIFSFILPNFLGFFNELGASNSLPLITRVTFSLVGLFRNPLDMAGYVILGLSLLLLIWRVIDKVIPPEAWSSFVLRIPVVGRILKQTTCYLFAQSMSLFYHGGLNIIQAIEHLEKMTSNYSYREAFQMMRKMVIGGVPISSAMKAYPMLFPKVLVQYAAVGESTGEIKNLMTSVSRIFEDNINLLLEKITILIEPLLLIVMGFLIGVILLSIFLPLYSVIAAF